MIINAVSYARFSSNNQREASIEIQQEHINKYCSENSITIIKEYVDRAFSATSDNRPQFQQMIKDAESGMFSYVIVYNSSRFCRNIQDHLKYRSILESFGVRLICVNENFDESTPEGDLMSNFMMSINQYYSKDLSRKTYLGCMETAKECLHVGGVPPLGYAIIDQKYFINEKEAEIVRFAFDYIDSGHTFTETADEMNRRGYRKRNGAEFDAKLTRMMRCRKYIGEYSWNMTRRSKVTGKTISNLESKRNEVVIVPNGIPAIISVEQFDRVQKALDSKTRNKGSNETNQYLLASILKCGCCGYRMQVDRNRNGNGRGNWERVDYRCYSRNLRRIDCATKPFRMDFLDAYVMNLLRNVLLNERYARHIYKLIREKCGEEYDRSRKELVRNTEEQLKIKDNIKGLLSSLTEARPIVYQEIINEVERLKKRQMDLEAESDRLKQEMKDFPYYNEETITQRIMKMKASITNRPMSEVRDTLRLVIKEIILTNEEVLVNVNLNVYISKTCKKNLEITLVEQPANIRDSNLHLEQRLTWSALEIRS